MANVKPTRRRVFVALLISAFMATSLLFAAGRYGYWQAYTDAGIFGNLSSRSDMGAEYAMLEKLAIIFPVNKNTDMQFYQNTWLRNYLYPVCDWPGPGCKIVCNRTSTYQTLDIKTKCFSRAIKRFEDKELFIKLDDDALVDINYVIGLIKKYQRHHKPVYISDHQRTKTRDFPDSLNGVRYGNGKFYMFNRKLAQCLKTDIKYRGSRNEDSVFGGMVSHGCGEDNVEYVQEDDRWIWHKEYTSKNKHIDLAFIKNH
ncbi:hypothetical protein GGH12_002239 [Coemansia sp. RSA 1822]|nr:hypothetical protein LPJ76_002976 [Coemansia sp. RSA 638]KAJ2564050.1 hypothetical protein GGH12_002239 [Coemansia sp. RSA 1822]